MTINDYINSCRAFAEDSREWGSLDPYKAYIATPNGGWAESCDNHENGIPLAWVFDVPGEYIDSHANGYYASAFEEEYRAGLDDGWSAEQFQTVFDKYEDCVVNRAGHVFCDVWDAIVNMMDDDLREQLHMELCPCGYQEFFSAYEKAHEKKFGEVWELSKDNPVW